MDKPAVGQGGKEGSMNTQAIVLTRPVSARLSMAFAALIGLGIVTLAGYVQASALHDAAHDVRHATGFPCH